MSWKFYLITGQDFGNQLLVTFDRLSWSCSQRRTKNTEVTTGWDNPPGHNPHYPMNSQTLFPWNITNFSFHHWNNSNKNFNFTRIYIQAILMNQVKFSLIKNTGFNKFPQKQKTTQGIQTTYKLTDQEFIERNIWNLPIRIRTTEIPPIRKIQRLRSRS